jgi:hypothetical protein
MKIQLTELEITLLEQAARRPSRLKAGGNRPEAAVIELLLEMQLVTCHGATVEITLLGQHLLKLARMPGDP